MDVEEVKGRVDFGIITIREDECEAVLDRLPKVDVVEARRRYRIRRLQLAGNETYTIAVVRCVEQGTNDALNTARDLLEDLDPGFLLVVGIAGGIPAYEFTLGDAIVCTRVADFSVEALLKDHSREYALGGGPLHPDAAKLAADIRAMVRDGDLAGWNERTSIGMDRPPVVMEENHFYGDDEWKKEVRDKLEHHFGRKPARSPLVVTGAVASSDRLVKEAETLKVWLKIARQIQAVEMESAGVYKAAHGRVPFLTIRGISDVVGFKRHPDWTTYACHSAAAFTRAFLLTKPVRPRARTGTQKLELARRDLAKVTASSRVLLDDFDLGVLHNPDEPSADDVLWRLSQQRERFEQSVRNGAFHRLPTGDAIALSVMPTRPINPPLSPTEADKRIRIGPMAANGWNSEYAGRALVKTNATAVQAPWSVLAVTDGASLHAALAGIINRHPSSTQSSENAGAVPSVAYEKYIIDALVDYLPALRTLGVSEDLYVAVSLLGVANTAMAVNWTISRRASRILSEDAIVTELVCAPAMATSFDFQSVAALLRPTFDYIWREYGYPRSFNYEEDGTLSVITTQRGQSVKSAVG